jgi:SAM-dependent methyltransferase
MENYDETTYGERIAEAYDEWYGSFDETCIERLAELAGAGGRALELGIGTGRIALPLLKKGVAVHGIDASEAMVARLRAKPGGERIPVTLGDFAEVAAEGPFDLVYVLFNTFFGLLTQEAQVRCFAGVARCLGPKGVFVMDAFVPDMTRFAGGQALRTVAIGEQQVRVDATLHDPAHQLLDSQHIVLSPQGIRLYPVRLHYAWPSELDLMAQLAGLRLRERWSDWQRRPFEAGSTKHISVYEVC